MWKSIGRDISGADNIYDKYFNAFDALEQEALNMVNLSSETEINQTTKEIEHTVQKEEAKKSDFDLNASNIPSAAPIAKAIGNSKGLITMNTTNIKPK